MLLVKLQVEVLLIQTLLHGRFSRFLNCTNGTKDFLMFSGGIKNIRGMKWVNEGKLIFIGK